jgi:hypothetical protein
MSHMSPRRCKATRLLSVHKPGDLLLSPAVNQKAEIKVSAKLPLTIYQGPQGHQKPAEMANVKLDNGNGPL